MRGLTLLSTLLLQALLQFDPIGWRPQWSALIHRHQLCDKLVHVGRGSAGLDALCGAEVFNWTESGCREPAEPALPAGGRLEEGRRVQQSAGEASKTFIIWICDELAAPQQQQVQQVCERARKASIRLSLQVLLPVLCLRE